VIKMILLVNNVSYFCDTRNKIISLAF